jgi:hypothetical protein
MAVEQSPPGTHGLLQVETPFPMVVKSEAEKPTNLLGLIME